jgi:hypothetical protein
LAAFLFSEVDVDGYGEVRGFREAGVVVFNHLIVNLCIVLDEMVEEIVWFHVILLLDTMLQLRVVSWIYCLEDEVA